MLYIVVLVPGHNNYISRYLAVLFLSFLAFCKHTEHVHIIEIRGIIVYIYKLIIFFNVAIFKLHTGKSIIYAKENR
jgi:hypothetical protein